MKAGWLLSGGPGFPLSFSHQIHLSFRQVISDVLKDHQKGSPFGSLGNPNLNEILFTGYHIVASAQDPGADQQ
jgi:hypothetical protein